MTSFRMAVVFAGLVACLATDVAAQGRRTVRRALRPIPNNYIVVLAPRQDADTVGRQSEQLFRGELRRVYRQGLRGFSMRMDRAAADALANDPRVLYVEEDGLVQISDTQANPPWGLDRIDQRSLPLDLFYNYNPLTSPVYIHVIDTGIRVTHQEFGGRAFIAGDFVDDDNNPATNVANDDGNPGTPDGADCHGHGTHVSGTAAGATYGVAKNALIYSYRALNCVGSGRISEIIAAIDAVTADGRRPAVANMSLGGDPSTAMDDAIRASIAAGVTYVVAAGNENEPASLHSPSRIAEAITVGATDPTDTRASFSNYGASLDVFAPGVGVRSAWFGSDSATAVASGTSMASPHVAGVAALYLQLVGDTAPQSVRDAIVAAATPGVVINGGAGSPYLLLYSGFTNPPPPGTRVNVARASNGGVATASSSYSPGYGPTGAINGDRRGAPWGNGGGWNDATAGAFPDWLQVTFTGAHTVDEVAVFSVQDNYASPVEPTASMTFTQYGLPDFTVQYWNGTSWQAVAGGVIRGNNLVWRTVTFPPVTTTGIRILSEFGQGGWSRIVEVEAYETTGGGGPNTPPTVSLTAPANGATYTAPAAVTIQADAADTDGTIREVAFFADGTFIGQDDTSPYELVWTNVPADTYTLTAVATDVGGASTTSASIDITVLPGAVRTNVALTTQGATATASSSFGPGYAPAGAINGDRRGAPWGNGGGWNDATAGVFPDWIEVAFSGPKTIDEVAVFSVQDNYSSPVEPTATMTFTQYGLPDFTVQYWNGTAWQAVPGGVVRGNNLVWRTVAFGTITTSRIRILAEFGQGSWSRVVEVEAYESTGGGGPNTPPTVSLTAPASGAQYVAPAAITIEADASDSDGTIREVAFYANGSFVAEDDTEPYSITWTNVAAGSYNLVAVATDTGGASTTSGTVEVTVLPGAVRTNVALASSGATAAASSTFGPGYAPGGAINGDRLGAPWGNGGGWNDATPGAFPDWLSVTFAGVKTIDEIALFSVQDNYGNPSAPTPSMTFTQYGLPDFTLQYWDGAAWQSIPGGVVRGNNLVWRSVTFASITTTAVRVLAEFGQSSWSRIVEVEAYEATGGGGPNTPPTVSLTSPTGGATFTAPASIALAADAADSDGAIRDVTFYANGSFVAVDATSPYAFTWNGVAAGSYSIVAVAADTGGASTSSAPVNVTVSPGAVRTNVALAANGATATASSSYSPGYAPSGAINGDRRGAPWGNGGGWNDGTANAFPDSLDVTFAGTKTIDEIALFSVQDNYGSPVEPTPSLTFTQYGVPDFTLQYWTGSAWQTIPGGVITGNNLVWRSVAFAPVTTSAIRVLVNFGQGSWSRVVEVEAYEVSGGGGSGQEYFVAAGATGDGSAGNPFGRIQDAIAVAQPGDTVTVQPGTYVEALNTVRDGTVAADIHVRAAAGRGSVVVTAPGRVLTVSHPYVTVEGLVIDGQYGLNRAVQVGGAGDYFTLRNSEVRRTTLDLIDIRDPQGVLIEGCLIHHALNPANGRTDAHGIVAGPARDLVVRDTEIHTFSGDGIQIDPGRSSPGWDNVTIERARIWLAPLPQAENGFPAGAITGENAVDTKASNSWPRSRMVIRDTTAWGFETTSVINMAAFVLKENVDVEVDRVTVYDSEIAFRVRGPASIAVKNAVVHDVYTAFRYEDDIQNLRVWNSTIGGDVTRTFQAASSSSATLDVRNVLVLGPLPPEASGASNMSAAASAFVNAALDDYRLSPGSPAIDAGTTIAGVTLDRAGIARPRGAAYDIGAYEGP
jgi:hypothetical protein